MGNYDKMATQGAQLFLQQDQDALLRRYPLEADEHFLYIAFLGNRYRIDRVTGEVLSDRTCAATSDDAPCVPRSPIAGAGAYAGTAGADATDSSPARDPSLATPRQALIVLDMVCNPVGAPVRTGSWITMAEASGASNNPSESALFKELIATFSGKTARLQAACDAVGAAPCPGGEVSALIDIFENYPVWLQFWDGDEEFPAQMKFLWDSSVRLYLHFETMWYILYEILERLVAC